MAVQMAKRLGAGRVIGAGRDAGRAKGAGADELVELADVAGAAEVDIVLDYLWGAPAQEAIVTLLTNRADRSKALDWVQIGSVAGPTIELPSVALRSANFRIQGNGQGAVSTRAYLAELPSLIDEIGAGAIAVTPRPTPLAEVEKAWARPDEPGERTVLIA
jgi:NADPH:quinone reductase-like Zn-dependent oxidoreductase